MLHDLFDADYYRRQIGQDIDDAAALRHFLTRGEVLGLDPVPYFSTLAYKALYPDWAELGAATAVEDFLLRLGAGERRQPHPLINPDYYCATYPDLSNLEAEALLHFIRHGDKESRSPSAEFDAGFYRRCYLPLGQGYPFRHYISEGAELGNLPKPQPRSTAVSRDAMRRATSGFEKPFVLALHDAQPAGVPILTLDIAQAITALGWNPVFVMSNAGPLAQRFRDLGPVFVLEEGWVTVGLAAGLPQRTPALINTAAAARLAPILASAGLNCIVLIHEMADYIGEQRLMPDLHAAQAAGVELITSMPRMASALASDLGQLDRIQPRIKLPETSLTAFREARRWRESDHGQVYIGAGHADRRKGFDLFIAAAERLARERAEARFVWLGALDHWAKDLASAARARGLNLTLPGFVPDTLAWYRIADAYLLTSRQDPGPTTAVHAAAMGTPFVGYAADIGLIDLAGTAGCFVAPGDETGFVEAALAAASTTDVKSRRDLRHRVRSETAFGDYVNKLLARLTAHPASG